MWSSSSSESSPPDEGDASDQDLASQEIPDEISVSSDDSLPPQVVPTRKRPRPSDSPASSSEDGDDFADLAIAPPEYVTPLEDLLPSHSQAAFMIQSQQGALSPLHVPPAAEFLPPQNDTPMEPPMSSLRASLPPPASSGAILLQTQSSLVDARKEVITRDAEIRELRQTLQTLQRNLERRDRDIVNRRDAEQRLQLEMDQLRDELRQAQASSKENERQAAELSSALSVERAAAEQKSASFVREAEAMQEGHRSREQRLMQETRDVIGQLQATEQRAMSLHSQMIMQRDKWESADRLAQDLSNRLRLRDEEIHSLRSRLNETERGAQDEAISLQGSRQEAMSKERQLQATMMELSETRGRLAAVTAELDKVRLHQSQPRDSECKSGARLNAELNEAQLELDRTERARRALENELFLAQQENARLTRYKDALEEQFSEVLNHEDGPTRVSAQMLAQNIKLEDEVAKATEQIEAMEKANREEEARRRDEHDAAMRKLSEEHEVALQKALDEKEDFRREHTKLQRQLKEKMDDERKVKAQLEEAAAEVLEAEQARDSYEAEICKMHEKGERLAAELRQAQNDRLTATLSAMARNSEVSFLTGQLERESSRIRALTEELRETSDRLKEKDLTLLRVNEELAKASAEVEQARTEMLAAQKDLKSCQWTKSLVEEEMRRLIEDLSQAEKEQNMRKAIAAESLTDLQEWLKESQQENLTIRDELRIMTSERDRLSALLLKIEQRQESEAKSARLVAREIELQEIRAELEKTKADLAAAEEAVQAEKQKATEAAQRMEGELQACKEESQKSQSEVTRLTKLLAQRESVITSLSQKSELAAANIQELKTQYGKERSALVSSLQEARATLVMREKAVALSETEKQADGVSTADMEDMKRQVEALKKSNVMLRQREQSRGGARHELSERGVQTIDEAIRAAVASVPGESPGELTRTSVEVPEELRHSMHRLMKAVFSSTLVLVAAKGGT